MRTQINVLIYGLVLILFNSCNNKENFKLETKITSSNENLVTTESTVIKLDKFIILYNSINKQENTSYTYANSERKKFQRFPGERKGTQLNKLNTEQRIQLHDLLNDILSPKGYLKILHIISNEDASSRVDDELGREKYWITFFGTPSANQLWGFRFEGHHISLNFSFRGNILISNSPFVYGALPSTMRDGKFTPFTDMDLYREGFNILFEEEDKALNLIASLDSIQYTKSSSDEDVNINIIGEDNEIKNIDKLYELAFQNTGLLFKDLNKEQQEQMLNLINCYFENFAKTAYLKHSLKGKETKFIISGKIEKNAKFYYRIVNKDFLIEFQNVGNHVHCLFRDFRNDFGIE